jgi:hypothetical protein
MLKIILGILLIVVLVAIGPVITIWAANTLFPALEIPYTIGTWLAVVIFGAFLRANVSVKK